MLRFAILKQVNEGSNEVVLEYNENQILSRLQARVREGLAELETAIKHKFTKQEIAVVLTKSYRELLVEFRDKTVTLK